MLQVFFAHLWLLAPPALFTLRVSDLRVGVVLRDLAQSLCVRVKSVDRVVFVY